MFKTIEDKALELYVSFQTRIRSLKEEAGQTSAEYIAVTAVAVLIAITVLYGAFNQSLTDAITTIGSQLESWVTNAFAGGGGSGSGSGSGS